MSKSICLLCHNTECDNSQQFKEDRQVCSAFQDKKVIDWEQRRYEIAKELFVLSETDKIARYSGETNFDYHKRVAEYSIIAATEFINTYQS